VPFKLGSEGNRRRNDDGEVREQRVALTALPTMDAWASSAQWTHGRLRRKQQWASIYSTALLDNSKGASSSLGLLWREQRGASIALPTTDAWASSAQAVLGLDRAAG